MSWESQELRVLLREGWQVKGFVADHKISGSAEEFSGETKGYSILLQKGEEMAIAMVLYEKGVASLSLEILTEERD